MPLRVTWITIGSVFCHSQMFPQIGHYGIAETDQRHLGDKNELTDKKSDGFFVRSNSLDRLAVFFCGESTRRVSRSKLCAADRIGVQWLPLCAPGTQSRRTKVQADGLRR